MRGGSPLPGGTPTGVVGRDARPVRLLSATARPCRAVPLRGWSAGTPDMLGGLHRAADLSPAQPSAMCDLRSRRYFGGAGRARSQ
jgi:hypothetical protein